MLVQFLHHAASTRFITSNIVIWIAFALLYHLIGMETHFVNGRDNPQTALYFSAVAQTTTGFGDITPKTTLSRLLVTAQLVLTWGMLALLMTKHLYRF